MKATRRVLVIGLDGATFTVLDDMRGRGLMPNLDRLAAEGASGVLTSTMPPITPAAWTTFMTGKTPGRHGIIDFERYDARTHSLAFNTTRDMLGRAKDIWRLLSDRGVRVGSLQLPMTYPPFPVNGFMVSGFDTASIDNQFTHPPELKSEILREIPDYTYSTNWRRKPFGGDALFAENCGYISRSLALIFGTRLSNGRLRSDFQ